MNTKAMVSEFLGTFALVFVGAGAIAANAMSGGASGLVGIALAYGLTFAVMVSATAASSGGHLNPAITVAALVGGKIAPKGAALYIICQCLGGIAGAYVITLVDPEQALTVVKMGTPALGPGITASQGLVAEIVLTFFLAFAFYGTVIDARAPKLGGLFVGLTVALGVLVGGPISGAAMNPARHLGPALLGGGLENIWIYWAGPLIGGALAGLLYHHVIEEK